MAVALLIAGCPAKAPRVPVTKPAPATPAPAPELTPAQRAAAHLEALLAAWPQSPETAADLLARLQAPDHGGPASLAALLTPRQRFALDTVIFERHLAQGSLAEARDALTALAPVDARQSSAAAWQRARWLARNGAHRAAAQTLMGMFEGTPADPAGVARALWRQMSKISSFELDGLARSGPNALVRGWAAVGRDLNAALTEAGRAAAWRAWQARNPEHVAARFPPACLGATAPERIAVLVPLTGDLAAFGAALRDGVLAAYLHGRPAGQEMVFFDTGALPASVAYERAVAAGADVIVGPLDKAAVAEVARLAPRLPVVALNTLDPQPQPAPRPSNVIQLALAVEDQAAAVAKALVEDGAERIALFHNDSAWAQRAEERLRRETRLAVVAAHPLQAVATITNLAADALDITASVARHGELEGLLARKLAFTPRRRDDLDAVVAFVEENELLALKPALNFHFAGDLPVYSWSRAPRGALGGQLDGVKVCDIPWRLHPGALRAEATAAFAPGRADSPLFALGVDGYRVANQLARLITHGESIAGSTGVLTLTDGGRLHRALAWGEAVGNRLRPLPSR